MQQQQLNFNMQPPLLPLSLQHNRHDASVICAASGFVVDLPADAEEVAKRFAKLYKAHWIDIKTVCGFGWKALSVCSQVFIFAARHHIRRFVLQPKRGPFPYRSSAVRVPVLWLHHRDHEQ